MPQLAFFIAGAAAPVGAAAAVLAWDRYDRGPAAADDWDLNGVGLYTWMAPTIGAQLFRLKTKMPITIPEAACPQAPDGYPNRDYYNRLEVKPGGTAMATVADVTFDIYEGSTLVYGIAPAGQTVKFEMADNSILPASFSVQDRPTVQAWEDLLEGFASLINSSVPARELWRALMTPHQPLDWF
jgi:hypothetical protein